MAGTCDHPRRYCVQWFCTRLRSNADATGLINPPINRPSVSHGRYRRSVRLHLLRITVDDNLRSSVPPQVVKRSELGGSWRGLFEKKNISCKLRFVMSESQSTFRLFVWSLSSEVCHVQVTVDIPTFCLVTIFSVESKELVLELEQPKKKSPSKKKIIKQFGKYTQKKIR